MTQFTEGKTYTATKGDNRFTGVQLRDHDYSVYLVQGEDGVGRGASLFIPENDMENWTVEEVIPIPDEPTGLGAVVELRNPKWIDSVFYVRGTIFPAASKPWSNSFVSASWDTLTYGLRGDTEVIVRSEGVDLGAIS